jgi:hypothetical protein
MPFPCISTTRSFEFLDWARWYMVRLKCCHLVLKVLSWRFMHSWRNMEKIKRVNDPPITVLKTSSRSWTSSLRRVLCSTGNSPSIISVTIENESILKSPQRYTSPPERSHVPGAYKRIYRQVGYNIFICLWRKASFMGRLQIPPLSLTHQATHIQVGFA